MGLWARVSLVLVAVAFWASSLALAFTPPCPGHNASDTHCSSFEDSHRAANPASAASEDTDHGHCPGHQPAQAAAALAPTAHALGAPIPPLTFAGREPCASHSSAFLSGPFQPPRA